MEEQNFKILFNCNDLKFKHSHMWIATTILCSTSQEKGVHFTNLHTNFGTETKVSFAICCYEPCPVSSLSEFIHSSRRAPDFHLSAPLKFSSLRARYMHEFAADVPEPQSTLAGRRPNGPPDTCTRASDGHPLKPTASQTGVLKLLRPASPATSPGSEEAKSVQLLYFSHTEPTGKSWWPHIQNRSRI